MRRTSIVILGACLSVGMLPAQAAPSRSAASPLNIEKIVYFGTPGELGTLKLVTEEDWGCNLLKNDQPTYLKWYMDDARDGDTDLWGHFVCVNNKLMFKMKSKKSQYEPIKAKRPDKHTVKVTFPFDLIEFKAKHLDVTAKSKDGVNCSPACKDTVGPLKAY